MRFYSNITKDDKQVLFLNLTEDEAEHLGGPDPRGTRLGLRPVKGDSKAFVLVPDPKARTRLHRRKRDNTGTWEAGFTRSARGFPRTGMTTMLYTKVENGFVLRPYESELTEPKSEMSSPVRNRLTTNREDLPKDKPPIEVHNLTKRAMVGVHATEQEVRDAIEIINDVMDRLSGDLEVQLRVEENRVRAKISYDI